jgi:hypothetical protein
MARCRCGNLLRKAVEERIADDDCSDLPLHGGREGRVDLGFGTGLQDLELQAFCVCCLLRRVDNASHRWGLSQCRPPAA